MIICCIIFPFFKYLSNWGNLIFQPRSVPFQSSAPVKPFCAIPIQRSSQIRSVPFKSSAPVSSALCHSNRALQSTPLCVIHIQRSSQLRSVLFQSSAPVNSVLCHSNRALHSTQLCAIPFQRSSKLRSVPFQSSAPVNSALCHSNSALQSTPLCTIQTQRSSQLSSVPFQSSSPVNSALCHSNPALQSISLCANQIQRSSQLRSVQFQSVPLCAISIQRSSQPRSLPFQTSSPIYNISLCRKNFRGVFSSPFLSCQYVLFNFAITSYIYMTSVRHAFLHVLSAESAATRDVIDSAPHSRWVIFCYLYYGVGSISDCWQYIRLCCIDCRTNWKFILSIGMVKHLLWGWWHSVYYRFDVIVSSVLISSVLDHVCREQINIEGNERADS